MKSHLAILETLSKRAGEEPADCAIRLVQNTGIELALDRVETEILKSRVALTNACMNKFDVLSEELQDNNQFWLDVKTYLIEATEGW